MTQQLLALAVLRKRTAGAGKTAGEGAPVCDRVAGDTAGEGAELCDRVAMLFGTSALCQTLDTSDFLAQTHVVVSGPGARRGVYGTVVYSKTRAGATRPPPARGDDPLTQITCRTMPYLQ
jgi:hypothetical protein